MDKPDFKKMDILGLNSYNRPHLCNKCGGIMIFKGVGEYRCEDCGVVEFDDYGKARNYIETHPGATASQVSEQTGVSQKSIRQMLKESKLEVTPDSRSFLKCEVCGIDIRHGNLCSKCEANIHRKIEDQERSNRNMAGYSMDTGKTDSGEKRFKRDGR